MNLDNSNPLLWFISFLDGLRVEILEKFMIPGLGISYWTFLIGVAIVAVVITVLINSIRVNSVTAYSDIEEGRRERLSKFRDGLKNRKSKASDSTAIVPYKSGGITRKR